MVYIKNETNPTIFKNPSTLKHSSNQESFRKNYLQEFIAQQADMNASLKNSSIEVSMLVNETKVEQLQQFSHVFKQLEHQDQRTTPLLENINKQEAIYNTLLERFEAVDQFNDKLIKKHENEGLINQVIIDQLTIQDSEINQISKKIEEYRTLNYSLTEQLDEQIRINGDVLNSIELQESFHKTILERLDHQDALNEKLSREIDTLKATLFERISFVVDKVEENYKQITGYVAQLFSKTGFIQRITVDKEKKQKETTTPK